MRQISFPLILSKKKFRHPAFWLMLLIRIIGAFLFFINPWLGWLTFIFLDLIDSIPWRDVAKLGSFEYEMIDKDVDTFIFVVMLMSSFYSDAFLALLGLLLFRLIGQMLFIRTKNESFLIIFPNLFEAYWLWAIAIPLLDLPPNLFFLKTNAGLDLVLLLKMGQELIKHKLGPRYVFPKIDQLWNKNRLMS
jgi:hypothetical protein